jgi:hypothetical protein
MKEVTREFQRSLIQQALSEHGGSWADSSPPFGNASQQPLPSCRTVGPEVATSRYRVQGESTQRKPAAFVQSFWPLQLLQLSPQLADRSDGGP